MSEQGAPTGDERRDEHRASRGDEHTDERAAEHTDEHADEPADEPAEEDGVDEVTSAVLTASRLLVAISVRSLAAVEDAVTLPQFRLLVVLSSRGPLKLVTLAGALGVNPSTAMRMVDRLTAAGLVDRQASPDSGREIRIQLTAAGSAIVDDVTARRRADIATIVARMPAPRRHDLVAALRAFTDAGGEPPVTTAVPLGWT
ncbi:MarR family transcriptional regulator [Actinomadura spongiicola]|uniref:MarR family transcriptional regulator n=1 Tax=Actinomadura spongiicola TaxID=2303421 RepID=A0A372GF15_9ACTN|nr:MarR family transcriptional regulator [Actinomadura spongiicola]RFS83940.1 MarR family transcriptional regulator [Actinomadura spongiicola]